MADTATVADRRFRKILSAVTHAGPAETDGPLTINVVSADAAGAVRRPPLPRRRAAATRRAAAPPRFCVTIV